MDCLLCYHKLYDSNYRSHYESVHTVDLTNSHFRKLFEPVSNAADKKCEYCSRQFSTHQEKKNHVCFIHYHRLPLQVGGSRRASCLNILRRGEIIDFSINFEQYQNHYNFFAFDIVPVFLDVVYRNFVPKVNVKYKFQGFIELLNWKGIQNERYPTPSSWFTKVYRFKTFNRLVRQELKEDMQNKVINNGYSGSSWRFHRFQSLKVLVTPLKYAQNFLTS